MTARSGREGEHAGVEIPEVECEESPSSPERALWCAVILQAWTDSFTASDWHLLAGEDKTADPDLIRGDARRFLVSEIDPWRSDREDVCAMANIDPHMIRAVARKRLEASREADGEREAEAQAKAIARMDTALAALLDRSSGMSDKMLDYRLGQLAEMEAAI